MTLLINICAFYEMAQNFSPSSRKLFLARNTFLKNRKGARKEAAVPLSFPYGRKVSFRPTINTDTPLIPEKFHKKHEYSFSKLINKKLKSFQYP